MKNIFITGANGFIGRSLCKRLLAKGCQVRRAVRGATQMTMLPSDVETVMVGNIDLKTDWSKALNGIDVVVHLAARVHVMHDNIADSLAEFRKVNTAGTLNLARQAVASGVKRFVFISSIKVNGEGTGQRKAVFTERDVPCPKDPYAVSKWEAEQGLLKIAEETGLEVVIIRPPLVYGPGVKANFRSLIKWVRKGVPLPLGAVHNKRSFVALDNLVSFIIYCFDHPKAANEVFLISDGKDLSTTELLQKIALAFEKRSFLLPVPVGWMTFVANMLGKRYVADRLFGSLQVDSSKARDLLGWKPVVSMDEGLNPQIRQKNKKRLM